MLCPPNGEAAEAGGGGRCAGCGVQGAEWLPRPRGFKRLIHSDQHGPAASPPGRPAGRGRSPLLFCFLCFDG